MRSALKALGERVKLVNIDPQFAQLPTWHVSCNFIAHSSGAGELLCFHYLLHSIRIGRWMGGCCYFSPNSCDRMARTLIGWPHFLLPLEQCGQNSRIAGRLSYHPPFAGSFLHTHTHTHIRAKCNTMIEWLPDTHDLYSHARSYSDVWPLFAFMHYPNGMDLCVLRIGFVPLRVLSAAAVFFVAYIFMKSKRA